MHTGDATHGAGQPHASDPPSSDSREVDARRLLDILERIESHVYTAEVTADGDYRELYAGPALEALLGGSVPDGVSAQQAWADRVHPDDAAFEQANGGGFANEQPTSIEYRMIGYDGVTRWVLDRMWPRPIDSEGRRIFDGVVTDVTVLRQALDEAQQANRELKKLQESAEAMARTDDLTGLSNRRHFSGLLRRHVAREDQRVGLLLIDIDHFKLVNDKYGHFAGDELLTEFARRLAATMRPADVVARWGGEEFVALLTDASDEAVLHARAEQIRIQLSAEPYAVAGEWVDISASIGGALTATTIRDAAEVLAAADRAMYDAKRNGRNRVALAPSSLGRTA